jgi:glycerate kinase
LLEGCPIVASHTDRLPAKTPSWRGAHGVGISQTVLVACAAFGPRLPADIVASAIAGGLQHGGLPEPDICCLPGAGATAGPDGAVRSVTARRAGGGEEDVRELLDALGLDARMRAARAVVIGARGLQERTLAGSVTFEIATRARQGGIPAYAVTAEDSLEPFDARILDLQLVLQALDRRALAAAGLRLASIV